MRCTSAIVLLICLTAVLASRHHPRHVVLRGHPTINTETQPVYVEDSSSASKKQFIVHVSGPVHHNDVATLEKDLGVKFDSYLPHNSFLMYASPAVAKAARSHPLVLWVGAYRPEYKLAGDVLDAVNALPANVDVHLETSTVKLNSLELVQTVSELSAAIPKAVVGPSGNNVLTVVVARKNVQLAIEALAAHPAVHTIDLAAEAVAPQPHSFVSELVEYGASGLTPVSASGLDGTGQVVGSGDSGITTGSCYFVDPLSAFTVQPGSRTFTSTSHRKFVLYNATYGDFLDGLSHGTPAVGAALGEFYTTADTLNNYEGVAPGAKVAFMDLQTGTNVSLSIPSNLASNYFSPLVDAGAKVILSAWGSYNSRRLYTIQEQAVDAYLAANPTVIAIFSAGNDGALGAGSINSPASSKNAIGVGASQNLAAGFVDALDTAPITALYANYVTRLCGPNSATSLDPLWSDATFCDGAVGVQNVPCNDQQTNWCDVFTGSTCCAYAAYAPFADCCVTTFTNAINFAPNSYGQNNLASFSSRGPTFDGRIKPDVTAPGESIKTAAGQNTCPTGTIDDTARAAAVTVSSGTSISAGVLAGAVTLIRQYFVDGYYPEGFASSGPGFEPPSALVKALLVAGAQPLTSISGTFTGLGKPTWGTTTPYDSNQGFGRVELASSLFLNSTNFNSPFVSYIGNGTLATGETWSKCISFDISTTAAITVAIAWTDPAAATSAGVALVNNLDLSISYQTSSTPSSSDVIAGASVVYPNGLGQPDLVNNVERITLSPNGQKNVFIRVYGSNVPQGPQNFWIVILGEFTEGDCAAPYLCPRSCSGAGSCNTQTGQCNCTATGVSGPDCTAALTCGSLGNCSGNGVCNSAGQCVCASGYEGSDCETNLIGTQTTGQVSTGSVTKKTGISVGVFVGVVIALFLFGCILALFIGVFGGLKYAEWRRQKTKTKANRMLSNDSRL